MLPWYLRDYTPRTSVIPFQTAKEVLMIAEKETIDERRSERLSNMIAHKSYLKHEDVPENKEIFVYGVKHIKTDKIDKFFLRETKSDELNENQKPFNFWSNEFGNREKELRNFEVTG